MERSWQSGREPTVQLRRLTCNECGESSRGKALGWRGYHCIDEDFGIFTGVFCPTCIEREFGEDEAAND